MTTFRERILKTLESLQPKRIYLDWNTQATNQFYDDDITLLKDGSPIEIAERLSGDHMVGNLAVTELLAHGQRQKAASVVRSLIEMDPGYKRSFDMSFGKVDAWLITEDLNKLQNI